MTSFDDFESWKKQEAQEDKKLFRDVKLEIELTREKGIMPFLKEAINMGASDIHLKNNLEVMFRHHGELKKVNDHRLTPEILSYMAYQILPPDRVQEYEEAGELDFTYALPSGHRFRMSVFKDSDIDTIAARLIAREIPTLEDLNLPRQLIEFTKLNQGLIVVTGPTGSGKSSTLAAMMQYINQNMQRHIITLEDPIEFVHPHMQSIISQREIGRDTKSFASGLKAALRQDPDILLVGELRDLETISIAITAAETGHVVFATLHTSSAASTVDRIIDVFPAGQQMQIRTQLANCLKGVVAQRLFKNPKGEGRVAACEILVVDSSIANLIRSEKVHQIPTFIQTGKQKGMQTMEDAMRELGL